MFKLKIPFVFALLMTIAGILGTSLLFSFIIRKEEAPVADNSIVKCNLNMIRLSGYKYIHPLLFANNQCESEELYPVRSEVENLINSYRLAGSVNTASVYLRQLNPGNFISIGESEKFSPGSLLKVPELITFMKMKEINPGLFDQKITYSKALDLPKKGFFLSRGIEVGKTYTIRELLYYMITYSDNYATFLLNQQMDYKIFTKVFTDFGLTAPDLTKSEIPISAQEYSFFMRALYNATYLDTQDSEYCLNLLTKCDFSIGMMTGIPTDIVVAHKFGEGGNDAEPQLGEAGIIFINNSPYLLVVMTKGKDKKILSTVIGDISKKVFQYMSHTNDRSVASVD